LGYPKYYFEHFSLIPKTELYNLLESYVKLYNSKKSMNDEKFNLKFFNITSDYYPKGLEDELMQTHKKLRDETKKRNEFYKNKLNELNDEFETDEIKSTMIKYSLNRINFGVTSEDNFGHQRVLRAISNSFFLNFDASFYYQISNINSYSMINKKFKKFFLSFYNDLKNEELSKFTRMNKVHSFKKLRQNFLQDFIIKNKLNNNGE
jgi:hypothetical protein